jgi:hypothetical protein
MKSEEILSAAKVAQESIEYWAELKREMEGGICDISLQLREDNDELIVIAWFMLPDGSEITGELDLFENIMEVLDFCDSKKGEKRNYLDAMLTASINLTQSIEKTIENL